MLQIKLTSLMVEDQTKALAFYTDVLGFQTQMDFPAGEHRWITVAAADRDDLQLALEPSGNPAGKAFQQAMFAQRIPSASFESTDLEADHARLAAKGVAFIQPPTVVGAVKIAVFSDTVGNLIQLHQPLAETADATAGTAEIAIYHGDRAQLMPLFLLADDSETAIAEYLARGTVLVATEAGQHVGHVQLIDDDAPGTCELKSLAVVASRRGGGLGRRLVEAGLDHARGSGARTVVLSTGTADTDLLRFYQRRGFRFRRVDRDIFTPAAGYPPELFVDGVRLLDRVWLDLDL